MKAVHLLRNPASGRRGFDADALLRPLAENGYTSIDITGETAEDSAGALQRAIEAGEVARLIIVGGDGLIHLAIQQLALTQIPIGIIPVGTGNDFATALGITSPDVARALDEPHPVDLIEVVPEDGPGHWIASIGILGFPAAINARANRMSKLGPAVYTVAAALELPRFSRVVVELSIDGDDVTTDSAMLAIGNTRFFGGGMLACPDATHDDSLLHVTSIEGVGRLGILRHLSRKSGGSADRPDVFRRSGREVRITTAGLALWGDGEPIGESPTCLRIQPAALHVAGANHSP
jgi:diacylglycerol kinase (ATP)